MGGHFQNAQVNCKKSDAIFGKRQAKKSHGFPGCGIAFMLVFATYLFLPPLLCSSYFYALSPSISAAFRAVSETFMLSFIDTLIHLLIYPSI